MTHLSGNFEIRGWDERPLEVHDDGRKLTRATVTRSFSGEMSGESSTEYLLSYAADKTAKFVGMESLSAKVEQGAGRVILQIVGNDNGKEASAHWEVVEGSGDGVFEGASGKGAFTANRGSVGEYQLHLKAPKITPPLILI